MIIKNWKKDLFTIPNYLSMLRLLLIPVYVRIYLHASTPGDYILAAGILAISCLTDALDGMIARKFHMVSTFGKFLDPLADKLTQLALILCLAVQYPMLWYLFGVFILKESFQLIAGILELRKGNMLTGALNSGKVCTAVLFTSLIILVLLPHISVQMLWLITIMDIIFMTISFFNYALTYYYKTPMIQYIEDHEDTTH